MDIKLFNKINNFSLYKNKLENDIIKKIPFTIAIGFGKLWPMGYTHGLLPIFVSKVFKEHSHVHLLTYCQ